MEDRSDSIADFLTRVINQELSLPQARREAQKFSQITPDELAMAEQKLKDRGIPDAKVYEYMHDFFIAFKDILIHEEQNLPLWHPIRTYLEENRLLLELLDEGERLINHKFIRNEWDILVEKLSSYQLHLQRKQNQLYAALEKVGFDRPSKIMWTLDNRISDLLKEIRTTAEEQLSFVWHNLTQGLQDLISKENAVLYPVSLNKIQVETFVEMRLGDDEIGYFLSITPPMPEDAPKKPLLSEEKSVRAADYLPLSQGKMTLKQIRLMLKHLPVDLSFVDEKELVCFYSDSKHRIFPRSPGVIGRDVKNCHPRESVQTVIEMLAAFRSGRENEAEFWLELNGKFIYIYYTAVRDEEGQFVGVLEMMQDATHIRSLQGSRRLLSWTDRKQ